MYIITNGPRVGYIVSNTKTEGVLSFNDVKSWEMALPMRGQRVYIKRYPELYEKIGHTFTPDVKLVKGEVTSYMIKYLLYQFGFLKYVPRRTYAINKEGKRLITFYLPTVASTKSNHYSILKSL